MSLALATIPTLWERTSVRLRSLANRGVILIGFVGAVVTLILGFRQFWGHTTTDGRWGLALVGSFAWFFLAFALFQEYRFSRKARYAEASPRLRAAYTTCLNGARQQHQTAEEVRRDIQEVCNELAQAFSLVTGTRCAACVKALNQQSEDLGKEEPRLFVATLCRDSGSRDRQGDETDVPHWVDANTDYIEIFKSIGKPKRLQCFFENDLPGRPYYNNTSFATYGPPPKAPRGVPQAIASRVRWPLPYRSTLVAAILPPREIAGENSLLGFLCVDSSSVGAFSQRYDPDWLTAFAEALHPLVMRWAELMDAQQQSKGDTK